MDFLIYVGCLGAGLVFTILSAVLGHFFGGDHGHLDGSGGHAEAGVDSSDAPGVSALSPTIICSFITSFGGFGIVFHQIPATQNPLLSAPLAVLGGTAVASGVLALLRSLFKNTQSSSESHVGTLVGTVGTIITPIPTNGVGEIAYVQGGARYTAPARAESGAAVANGASVRIARIAGTQFYVIPV
jgi:membrane protein implicated in regulation of membrane protease activity